MNLENGVLQVHIEDIIPNRFQPRLTFDEQGLIELSDSIREHGIIQPLVLRKLGNKYEIIAGERRYKAAQMAGLTTVPAVIANIDDNKSAEVALVENVQRRDLTAIEEARSYKNLLDKGYLTQEQLAKRMGLSQPAVANKLRLLNLDEEVQQALLEEKISERHARTLLTLQDKNAQKEWLHKTINERLTVRQLDLELKKLKETPIQEPAVDNLAEIETETINEPKVEKVEEKMPEVETFTSTEENLEFNISTPNSTSNIINVDSLATIEPESSKFFNFDMTSTVDEIEEKEDFKPEIPETRIENGLEVFDADTPTIEEKEEEPIIEEVKPTFDSSEYSSMNDMNINAHNKFFTPINENIQEISIINDRDQVVDPMQNIEKLTPEYRAQKQESAELGLKGAIGNIRKCIQDLGDKGFYISVEEIDLTGSYQITININKDND